MKNILVLLCCLFAFDSFAKSVEVDVISAEFGVEDNLHHKSLCMTVVRVPSTGSLLGIVEDIYDCFIARSAKKSPNHKIKVDLKSLKPMTSPELHSHLQSLDSQLEFLFSEGE